MKKEELIKELDSLRNNHADLHYEAWKHGLFLSQEPFLPEYMGFEERKIEDKDGVLSFRVYYKDGFTLSRYVSVEKKQWIVVDPNGLKTEILISSMEMGVKILQALGFETSIMEYYSIVSPEMFMEPSINIATA